MPAAVYAITSPVAGAASGPSSVTASLPTGSVAGDLCFLHFAGRGSTTGSQTLTPPAGWTAIGTPVLDPIEALRSAVVARMSDPAVNSIAKVKAAIVAAFDQ